MTNENQRSFFVIYFLVFFFLFVFAVVYSLSSLFISVKENVKKRSFGIVANIVLVGDSTHSDSIQVVSKCRHKSKSILKTARVSCALSHRMRVLAKKEKGKRMKQNLIAVNTKR